LIDELFKTTQKQMNKFKFNFQEVYADELIIKIFEPIKERYINNSDIKVEYNTKKMLVNVDATRIEQVITNLLNNAIKNTPQNETEILKKYFKKVDLEEFSCQIVIDKAEPIVAYVNSCFSTKDRKLSEM
jgi:K+-sensing histidine kinase KdpD